MTVTEYTLRDDEIETFVVAMEKEKPGDCSDVLAYFPGQTIPFFGNKLLLIENFDRKRYTFIEIPGNALKISKFQTSDTLSLKTGKSVNRYFLSAVNKNIPAFYKLDIDYHEKKLVSLDLVSEGTLDFDVSDGNHLLIFRDLPDKTGDKEIIVLDSRTLRKVALLRLNGPVTKIMTAVAKHVIVLSVEIESKTTNLVLINTNNYIMYQFAIEKLLAGARLMIKMLKNDDLYVFMLNLKEKKFKRLSFALKDEFLVTFKQITNDISKHVINFKDAGIPVSSVAIELTQFDYDFFPENGRLETSYVVRI